MEKPLGQQFNLKIKRKNKIRMNVVRRIIFEIVFFLLIVIMMPWHYFHAIYLLTIEIFKHYPKVLHKEAAVLCGYDVEDDEDS